MRRINRKGTLASVLGGVSVCALAVTAMGQSKGGLQNPAMEQVGDPVQGFRMTRLPVSPITYLPCQRLKRASCGAPQPRDCSLA